jgi:6-phosphogluconate dehydrogenase
MIVISMGVTGCGKTTLGQMLASKRGLPFYDADDFHPESNRQKLRQDIALTDEDRLPWLQILHDKVIQWENDGGAILACSALKQSYHDVLSGNGTIPIQWVYLQADKQLIANRLEQRAQSGHPLIRKFEKIITGQFADLEEPTDALVLNAAHTPDLNLQKAMKLISSWRTKETSLHYDI